MGKMDEWGKAEAKSEVIAYEGKVHCVAFFDEEGFYRGVAFPEGTKAKYE